MEKLLKRWLTSRRRKRLEKRRLQLAKELQKLRDSPEPIDRKSRWLFHEAKAELRDKIRQINNELANLN